jgi:hypothetical protein
MSLEKPRVLTTVGKKFLNPFAARCFGIVSMMVCMDWGGGFGCTYHMGHSSENPDHGIFGGLAETSPNGRIALVSNSIESHTVCCQIALFLSQPPCVVWEIWQKEETDDSNDKRHNTLKDKEPAPSADASDITQTVKDTRGDQSRKSSREDVSGVQDGDTSSDFLASIEHRQQIHSSRVVGSLCDTEEEARKQQALEIFGQRGKSTDDSPEHHANTHVA